MARRELENDPLPMPNGWFAVEWSRELREGDVKPLEYFGEELVLFRTRSGEARVLDPNDPLPMFTLRMVRIPEARALEFAERLATVAEDFVSQPRDGDVVYGLIAGVFPTERPILSEEADE